MRRDPDNLKLCDRLLDAIARRDIAAVESCYAPECIVWRSGDYLYQQRNDNIAQLKDIWGAVKTIEYIDRLTRPFEGGFVAEYKLAVVHANDFAGKMECCLVAYTRDGMISRLYEYWSDNRADEFFGPEDQSRR